MTDDEIAMYLDLEEARWIGVLSTRWWTIRRAWVLHYWRESKVEFFKKLLEQFGRFTAYTIATGGSAGIGAWGVHPTVQTLRNGFGMNATVAKITGVAAGGFCGGLVNFYMNVELVPALFERLSGNNPYKKELSSGERKIRAAGSILVIATGLGWGAVAWHEAAALDSSPAASIFSQLSGLFVGTVLFASALESYLQWFDKRAPDPTEDTVLGESSRKVGKFVGHTVAVVNVTFLCMLFTSDLFPLFSRTELFDTLPESSVFAIAAGVALAGGGFSEGAYYYKRLGTEFGKLTADSVKWLYKENWLNFGKHEHQSWLNQIQANNINVRLDFDDYKQCALYGEKWLKKYNENEMVLSDYKQYLIDTQKDSLSLYYWLCTTPKHRSIPRDIGQTSNYELRSLSNRPYKKLFNFGRGTIWTNGLINGLLGGWGVWAFGEELNEQFPEIELSTFGPLGVVAGIIGTAASLALGVHFWTDLYPKIVNKLKGRSSTSTLPQTKPENGAQHSGEFVDAKTSLNGNGPTSTYGTALTTFSTGGSEPPLDVIGGGSAYGGSFSSAAAVTNSRSALLQPHHVVTGSPTLPFVPRQF